MLPCPQGVTAVRGISLVMQPGACFALLGHNGAGKTTAIKMITGQLSMSSGDAVVHGLSAHADAPAVRRLLGICPQHDILYEELSAIEHLQLYGALKGRWLHATDPALKALIEAVKLTKVRHKRAGTYSGGMKRRLSCIVAFVGEAQVVMLDEPTTGMDPMSRNFVWDYLRLAKVARVLLLTTHSMEEADALGDRIGIMSEGQLTALGSSVHLKRRFGNGYRMQLVAPEGSCAVIKEKVGVLLPAAQLKDESAGNLIYTVNLGADAAQPAAEPEPSATAAEPSATVAVAAADNAKGVSMAAATELFAYLEAVQRGEHQGIELTDWGVSHTTLEDVFLKLAKVEETKSKPRAKKGVIDDRNIDAISGSCGSAGSETATGVSPALGANREGDMEAGKPRNLGLHQVKALMHKTFQIQRRQRCQFFWCFLFVPLIYASMMPILQYFLVTRAFELTMHQIFFYEDYLPRMICSNATEVMRMACKAQNDTQYFATPFYEPVEWQPNLRGGKGSYDGCYMCDTTRADEFPDHYCDPSKEDRCRTKFLGDTANGERVRVPSEEDEQRWWWLDPHLSNPRFDLSCSKAFWYDNPEHGSAVAAAANLAGGALFRLSGGYNKMTRALPDFCACEGPAFDALVAGMESCQSSDAFQRMTNSSQQEIEDGHTYTLPRELRAKGGRHAYDKWHVDESEDPQDGGPSAWAAGQFAGWRIMVAATANGKPLDEDAAMARLGQIGAAGSEAAFVGYDPQQVQQDMEANASGLLANMPHAVVVVNKGSNPVNWDRAGLSECQAVDTEHTCCIEVELRATYAPGNCWDVASHPGWGGGGGSSYCDVVLCTRERSLDKPLFCLPCSEADGLMRKLLDMESPVITPDPVYIPPVPGCGGEEAWTSSEHREYEAIQRKGGLHLTFDAKPETLTRYCSTPECLASRCVQDSITGNWSSPVPSSSEEGGGSGSGEAGSGEVSRHCAAAKCQANPLFVTPIYAQGNSMGDITESMLRYSEVFLDGKTADGSLYIEDIPPLEGPFPLTAGRGEEWPGPGGEWWDFLRGVNGESCEAERFVPSAAIEFADVDVQKLRGTFKLASSWGFPYPVFEAVEHSHWYTKDRWSWVRQFEGVAWPLIKSRFPSGFNLAAIFQNWLTNALLRTGIDDGLSITTRMRHLPKSVEPWWLAWASYMETFSNLMNLYNLSFGTIAMLPVCDASPGAARHTCRPCLSTLRCSYYSTRALCAPRRGRSW